MGTRISIPWRAIGGAAIMGTALALAAGCQTMETPTPPAPEPSARLLDAGRLALPTDCVVSAGRTYRMSYTVGLDGRTGPEQLHVRHDGEVVPAAHQRDVDVVGFGGAVNLQRTGELVVVNGCRREQPA